MHACTFMLLHGTCWKQICGYYLLPKAFIFHDFAAGQTWLLTMVHLIGQADLLENDQEVRPTSSDAMNFLDMITPEGQTFFQHIADQPPPRIIKTHMPLRYFKETLEKNPDIRVLQIIRNPKDTLVSYFHHYRRARGLGHFIGTWDDFFNLSTSNKTIFGDLFEHTKEWYLFNKTRQNSLIVFFEDLKRNLKENVAKIAAFLGKPLSDKVLNKIVEMVTFDNMNANPKLNMESETNRFSGMKGQKFMRKGKVGDWVEQFSKEQSEKIDEKVKECFDPIGLKLDFT